MITQHDEDLIYQALDMRWEDIAGEGLEEKTETEEGRRKIHDICMSKFHRAEYNAGWL